MLMNHPKNVKDNTSHRNAKQRRRWKRDSVDEGGMGPEKEATVAQDSLRSAELFEGFSNKRYQKIK